jgi:hypothetical protein
VAGLYVLPPDGPRHTTEKFDVVGSILLAAGLGIFNFCWNEAPLTGWSANYVWPLLIVSIAIFVAFYLWERRMGTDALIPTTVLQRNNIMVYLSLWLGWMSLGVFLFYTIM